MNSLSSLEEQINELNTLHKGSTKTLDTFAETSNAIAVRARSIAEDVQKWEIAQDNIAATIAEMSRAARCYHPPPSLPAVLAKKEQQPKMIARCIDYLVYTADYLQQHPSNIYSDKILDKIDQQIDTTVQLAEDVVRESFIRALEKPPRVLIGGGAGVGGSTQAQQAQPEQNVSKLSTAAKRVSVIHNSGALDGVEELISRLRENFNRVDVVQTEVRELLLDKMKSVINAQFDSSYSEDLVEKTTNQPSTASAMKHYQRGDHRLIKISAVARSIVHEVSDCYNTYVLVPLDNAYEVNEVPGEMASAILDIIMRRAFEAIAIDQSVFADPTRMFIESRGQGVGLCPGRRYVRDIMFIGLDLVEELWQWKTAALNVSGNNDLFCDAVDNELSRFLEMVRELVDAYENCNGALDQQRLKQYSKEVRRFEWIPATDCTAHESTTNVFYLHKVLLSSYYGALKLALCGTQLDADSEITAAQAVESFLMHCAIGSLSDLQVIVDTATEIKRENDHERRTKLTFPVMWSKEVFLVNNIVFLLENYRKERCFHMRVIEIDDSLQPPAAAAGARRRSAPKRLVPIVENVTQMLTDERERYIDEYGETWSECFPSMDEDPVLVSIKSAPADSSVPLSKSQRLAVKHWFKSVAQALSKKIAAGHTHAVMDSFVRTSMIDVAITVVQDNFGVMDDILVGRTWSRRPLKWMENSQEDWMEEMRRMF